MIRSDSRETGSKLTRQQLLMAGAAGGLSLAAAGGSTAQASAKAVTLNVWDFEYFPSQPGWGPALKNIDKAFQKANPDIKIVHYGYPYDSIPEKYRSAIAARSGPDVMMMYPWQAPDYKRGLLPLTSFINGDAALKRDILYLDAAKNGDTWYAVPQTAYGYMIEYNKALFQKAGITKLPTDWNGLLAACEALKKAGVTPFGAGWADGSYLEWMFFVFAGQLVSPAEAAKFIALDLPYTSPQFHTAMALILKLKERGYFTKDAESVKLYNDVFDDFATGKCAMYLGYGSDLPSLRKSLDKKLGLFLIPLLPGAKYAKPYMDAGINSGWSITAWSKHPKEAWKYLQFQLSAPSQRTIWNIARRAPNSRKALVTVRKANTYAPAKTLLNSLALPGNHTLFYGERAQESSTLYKFAVPVMSGQMSVGDFLGELQKTRDDIKRHG